jgi:hypothetical protein
MEIIMSHEDIENLLEQEAKRDWTKAVGSGGGLKSILKAWRKRKRQRKRQRDRAAHINANRKGKSAYE